MKEPEEGHSNKSDKTFSPGSEHTPWTFPDLLRQVQRWGRSSGLDTESIAADLLMLQLTRVLTSTMIKHKVYDVLRRKRLEENLERIHALTQSRRDPDPVQMTLEELNLLVQSSGLTGQEFGAMYAVFFDGEPRSCHPSLETALEKLRRQARGLS